MSIRFRTIKVFLKIASFVLIGIILLGCYVFFWGPPFGNLYANKEISKYINTLYGNEVKIDMTGYNLVTHTYNATINKNSSDENIIKYNMYTRRIYDAALSTQMNVKFKRDFLIAIKSFPQNYIFPTEELVVSLVDVTGGYNSDTDKMKYMYKLYLSRIVNTDPYAPEYSSEKELAKIVQALLDKLEPNYMFFGMQVDYIDATGVYTIEYDKSNLEKLHNNIENHIVKLELKDIPINSQILIDSIKSKKK